MKRLNRSQAEAIYNAMCHLNNVCGTLAAYVSDSAGRELTVGSLRDGRVFIQDPADSQLEIHATQHAFAHAYGLEA